MSSSPLGMLPVELMELVVAPLDLAEIAALRLTCRIIEAKVAQGRFASFFQHHTVPVETRSLKGLVNDTRQSHLICQLRHCTLAGILEVGKGERKVYCSEGDEGDEEKGIETDEAKEDSRECTRLLTQAFSNLKKRSLSGRLATVRLCLSVRQSDGTLVALQQKFWFRWRHIWSKTSRTFRIVMAALEAAQLSVDEELDLFRVDAVQDCLYGLASNVIVASVTAGTFPWTAIFKSIKTLRLSASSPTCAVSTEQSSPFADDGQGRGLYAVDSDDADGKVPSELRPEVQRLACTDLLLLGVLKLRRLLPNLENVDLHWIDLAWSAVMPVFLTPAMAKNDTRLSPKMDGSLHLKECQLRGLYVAPADLIWFLQCTQPKALTLQNITMNDPNSECDALFGFLTDPMTLISSYVLDDLFVPNMVHFDIPGRPKYPYTRGQSGTPSTLSRQGSDVKDVIGYHVPHDRLVATGNLVRWRLERRRVYGPPNF